MWHIATPIMVGGQHVGNIISGQFFFKDEPLDYELFRSKARKYGFNEEEYIAALKKVPRLSKKAADTGMSFFMKLVNMISQLSYSNIKLAQSLTERDIFFEALRESEEKHRNIVEIANEGILILNAEAMITYVNEKMAKMLECTQDEIISKSVKDFTDENGKIIFEQNVKKRRQSIDESHVFKFVLKDGSPLWTLVNSKALFDKSGKFMGSLSMLTDITERKRDEQVLCESEARFRSAFDDSAVAMALVGPDAHLLKVNDAFCQMLGFEKLEMEGRTFLDFTFPDDIEPSIFAHKAVMNSEKPLLWIEKRYIRKDGRIIWCEVSSSPVLDSKGCPIYTVAHVLDITEHKDAEEALRESEEKFRGLVEHVNDWVWEIDKDRVYTYSNPRARELLGYELVDIVGTTPFDYMTSEEADRVRSLFDLILNARKEFSLLENTLIRKDGSTVTVETSGMPIYDSQGNFSGYRGIDRDITKRKEAEEALKKAHVTLEAKVKERTAELERAYNSLKESEELLEEAQEMAHIGSWNRDFVTNKLYWSDEVYRIFGFKPKEFGVTYELFLNCIHLDDRDYVDNAVKRALDGEPCDIDYRIILPGGSERVVHSHREVVYDEKKCPIRIRGTNQDITERKKADEKIQNLANIVESSEDAIVTLTLDYTIISWNKGAEKVYGYSVEEILGKCVSTLAPLNLRDETIRLSKQVKKGEKIRNYETIRQRKDGKMIYVSFSLSPVFDIHEKLTAISFISRDITKRKEAEKALNNIEIARKQEIHHRIKNNLQVISSLLDLQAEKFKGKKNIKESLVLEAFKESQDRVISMALIHEELHKSGEIDTLNFSEYIYKLADNLFLSYRLGNDGASLDMNIEEDIFFDMDVAVPLGIIINELVSNSLKHAFFGRDKGEIIIELHRDEPGECNIDDCKSTSYVLTISDNGVGILEDLDIEDFDSLGLQLVTTLVDQLDGELELKRDSGTEFIIRFAVNEKSDQIPWQAAQLVE